MARNTAISKKVLCGSKCLHDERKIIMKNKIIAIIIAATLCVTGVIAVTLIETVNELNRQQSRNASLNTQLVFEQLGLDYE